MARVKAKRKKVKRKKYYENSKKRLSSITKQSQSCYRNLLEEETEVKRKRLKKLIKKYV